MGPTPQPSAWACILALVALSACDRVEIPPASASNPPAPAPATSPAIERDAALRSARVWLRPAIPVSRVDFAANPPGPNGFPYNAEVSCRFSLAQVGGTTPKFYCELPNGDKVKVKYGKTNPEIHTEVAATRLLSALGFPTDAMYVVRVRCAGCPKFPFPALKCAEKTGIEKGCFAGGLDYNKVETFIPATIERRLAGETIEATDDQGWSWTELERIDAAAGGSSLAEVDALRLMAVFLAHWDNKSPNQRLTCPAGKRLPNGRCAQPLAIVQDLGGTFGPVKLELHNWRQTPVWVDPSKCLVSMKSLPYKGATFGDRHISEGGRQLLLRQLEQLSEAQLIDLFKASGMADYPQINAAARNPQAWAQAFQDKVRQIRAAGPCP